MFSVSLLATTKYSLAQFLLPQFIHVAHAFLPCTMKLGPVTGDVCSLNEDYHQRLSVASTSWDGKNNTVLNTQKKRFRDIQNSRSVRSSGCFWPTVPPGSLFFPLTFGIVLFGRVVQAKGISL